MVPPQKEVITMTKRKKKNKALPLIILIVLLIGLIGTYVFLQNLPDEDDTVDNAEVSIPLSDYSADNIVSVSYGDSEPVTIVKENGTWFLDGDERFPLDQTKASKMAESIASLSASKEVDSNELAEFGLDTPSLTVKVKLTDGDEYCYSIGDVNSFNSLTYILTSDKVYMFTDDLSKNFDYSKDELMLIDDSFPTDITNDNIQSVIIRDKNGKETSYSSTDLSLSDLKKCFSFDDVNTYGLTDDEMVALGFKEDGASVIIKYSTVADTSTDVALNVTFKILLGEVDGKIVYALNGGDMTYDPGTSILEELLNTKSSIAE